MKIILAKDKISQMTNDELKNKVLEMPPIPETKKYLQEADKRNYLQVFEIASRDPRVINDPLLLTQIINKITKNINDDNTSFIFNNILTYSSPNLLSQFSGKIFSLCTQNPELAAMALLESKTPKDMIYNILNYNSLNVPSQALYFGEKDEGRNNPVLKEIIDLLKNGFMWENTTSGILMISRLIQNSTDKFITEMAKYNVTPDIASGLINAADQFRSQNKQLKENIEKNKNPGVKLIKINTSGASPHVVIPSLIEEITNPEYKQYIYWIWEFLRNNMLENDQWFLDAFNIEHMNNNILVMLSKQSDKVTKEIINMIKQKWQIIEHNNMTRNTPSIEEIIHIALTYPSIKNEVLKLPQDLFDQLPLTDEHRRIVDEHFNIDEPKNKSLDPQKEILRNLFGNKNTNWYERYANTSIEQEAGIKENLMTSILSALVLILSGSTIQNAAQRSKIAEEQLIEATKNEELMNKAKNIFNNYNMQQEQIPQEQIPQEQQKQIAKNILARTLYAESKGESYEGKIAVASVIFNRGRGNLNQMIKAIKIPSHFSCWNSMDWNEFTIKDFRGRKWEECSKIAEDIINGSFTPTTNANHYYNPKKCNPYWAYLDKAKTKPRPYKRIGNHNFININ